MGLRERVVGVLESWCGGEVDGTDETLEDLWNRTKPTSKPSHSGIDFFSQGASDLVDRLVTEYHRPGLEIRNINFDFSALDPQNGTILTVDDLFTAVQQSPIAMSASVTAMLSAGRAPASAAKPKKASKASSSKSAKRKT